MEFIISNAKVYDYESRWDGRRVDIHFKDGLIDAVRGASQSAFGGKGMRYIRGHDLGISPGWVDMRADLCDPGDLHLEDIDTGLSAARAGGFTDIVMVPNTDPALQSKSEVSYVKARAQAALTRLHVVGALTRDCKGTHLNDLYELAAAGVCAYGDGHEVIEDPHVLVQGLRYACPLDKVIIQRPLDRRLGALGVAHESGLSAEMGLSGSPSLAESIVIQRDLRLLNYAGGRLHFSLLSTAESVALLKNARKKQPVSADVSIHHLVFDETNIDSFDSHYHMRPPYRSSRDRRALINGVKQGYIDAIVSDHRPWAPEHKERPFGDSEAGAIGLPIVFPLLNNLKDQLSLDCALRALYDGPRRILNWPKPKIETGEKACFTFFDTQAKWPFSPSANPSKSNNSPFMGQTLTGKVIGIAVHNQLHLNPLSLS